MSTKHDNGGPAFPVQEMSFASPSTLDESKAMARGISVRDYFIAHAPSEPQPWFKPVMPPRPVNNPPTPRHPTAVQEWFSEEEKQRYVQWPSAWADEQLKARQR